MLGDGRASLAASFLIALVGAAAVRLLPTSEASSWLLLGVVGLAFGATAGRPGRVWLALAACALAEAWATWATGAPDGPFWYIVLAGRLVVLFVTGIAGPLLRFAAQTVSRRWLSAAIGAAVASAVVLGGYAGYAMSQSGTYLAQAGESDCRNPGHFVFQSTTYEWPYEAINYDQADDARLVARHPNPKKCVTIDANGTEQPDQGEVAGTEVMSSDGIHVAGWYIPAGDGAPPTAPTLVLVHGGKDNKSGMLKYAVPLHRDYNLVLLDLRNQGRSSDAPSTGGLREALDLRAMIDWLERTKRPSWLGIVGNSNGAATTLAEAIDDPRPQALVLDSMHASVLTQLGVVIETENDPRLPAWPAAWAVVTGASLQVGADITAADPVRTIALVGDRRVLLTHGALDAVDRPADSLERNLAAAIAAGVAVEVHVCPTAGHGKVVADDPPPGETPCTDAWGTWVLEFLARAQADSGP